MAHIIENQIQKFVESIRPPVKVRDQVDIGYTFEKNTLKLFEIRPQWDNKDEKRQLSFAKARYLKSQQVWKIYWMRASGKWQSYEPVPETTSIQDFFDVLEEDEHGCFFG